MAVLAAVSPKQTFTRRYLQLVLAAAATWYAVSAWLGPVVVRQAWAAEGPFGFLAPWLPGRDLHPVGSYLETWRELSLEVTVAFVPVALVIYLGVQIYGALRADAARDGSPGRSASVADGGGRIFAPKEILALALLFGLGTGLVEAYYLATRAFLLQRPIPEFFFVSPHSLWMAPMVDASLVLLLGGLVASVSRGWHRLARDDVVVGLLSAAGVVMVVMPTQRIHLWACLPLAAGVGAQMGRAASGRRAQLVSSVPRWCLVLVAVVLVTATSATWLELRGPQVDGRRVGEPTGSSDEARPNVVLIVLDTERASELSVYGYRRNTSPELNRLAARGVVFERAIAPSSWTLPSHASLFTGLPPTMLGYVRHRPLVHDETTIAEGLSMVGYRTGGFVANFVMCSDFWGFDRGFEIYRDQPVTLGMALSSSWTGREISRWIRRDLFDDHQKLVRKTAAEVNREFLAWRDELADGPYFAFLNYFDAHAPYLPPSPFDRTFTNGRDDLYWLASGIEAEDYGEREVMELQGSYDNGVAYADHQLGRLVAELRRRGDAERTWLVITSDHGEQFGEHGLLDHDNSLYMPLLHVPLVIVPPEGRSIESTRVRTPVGLTDVPATVMDIVGNPAGGVTFPGTSLLTRVSRPSAGDDRAAPDTIVSEWRGARSLVAGDLHYIRHGEGEEELYDLSADPAELEDLAGDTAYARAIADFRAYLERWHLLPGDQRAR